MRLLDLAHQSSTKPHHFHPFHQETRPEDAARWRALGLRAIAQGRVGALLLAGGQGTRLGSDAPKGCYDIGLPSRKSLFQLHAERLLKLERLAAAALAGEAGAGGLVGDLSCSAESRPAPESAPIRFWIMTSEATDAATRAFFEEHAFFGLRPAQVSFLSQGALPALDERGRAILASPGRLALSPNGNGGIYTALRASGALREMVASGVEALDCWPVDNALAQPLSPEWVGRCLERRADVGCRVLARRGPDEKVGVAALVKGSGAAGDERRLAIVEYSELSPERAARVDAATGKLVFNWANACLHFFSRAWLERATDYISRGAERAGAASERAGAASERAGAAFGQPPPLTFHVARKTIPSVHGPVPGIKLELFIFDPFFLAQAPCMVEVERGREFAPVKNAPGSGVDCPETARAAVLTQHRAWIEAAGGVVEAADGVEVSPLVSLAGEGLESICRGQIFTHALDPRLQQSI